MQIVLLERIAKLGQMGEIVNVKDGYARNFLLPKGKALRANKENLVRFETDRAQLEARNLEQKSEASTLETTLNGETIIIIRQSSETGQLYGSVNTRDIAATLTENGFSLDRSQIALDAPIKTLGLHKVSVVLHPEVSAEVIVNVARTQDEAEQQARGEDVTGDKVEAKAEETIAVEEVFEEGAAAPEAAEAADLSADLSAHNAEEAVLEEAPAEEVVAEVAQVTPAEEATETPAEEATETPPKTPA